MYPKQTQIYSRIKKTTQSNKSKSLQCFCTTGFRLVTSELIQVGIDLNSINKVQDKYAWNTLVGCAISLDENA